MTFGLMSLVIAYGLGFVTCMGLFLWVNRKAPGAVDAVEDAVRKP